MKRHQYDAVVVGGGLGGLTAGAICAMRGKRVLLLERGKDVGGAATVYRRGLLTFEASLQQLDGLDVNDTKYPLFKMLGVLDHIDFIKTPQSYQVLSPILGEPFVMPTCIQQAYRASAARFPGHQRRLEEYFDRIACIREAVSRTFFSAYADYLALTVARAAPAYKKDLLAAQNESVADVFNNYFGDDEAPKLALGANIFYYHDDPAKMSFLYFANAQASYLIGGSHYIRSGSFSLSHYLKGVIIDNGGAVELSREVKAILLQGERVGAVEHSDIDGVNRELAIAPCIFSNVSPIATAKMLPGPARHRFMLRYVDLRPSISLWKIVLALRREAIGLLRGMYATYVYPEWMTKLGEISQSADLLQSYLAGGKRLPPYCLVNYAALGEAVEGSYNCAITGIDNIRNWDGLSPACIERRKRMWINIILDDVEKISPAFGSEVSYSEMATSQTVRKYLGTTTGEVYGFSPDVGTRGIIGGSPETDIQGLWLSSAYTIGGGYTGAILGGALAAWSALREK